MSSGQFKKGHIPHNKGKSSGGKYSRLCSKCKNKYQNVGTQLCFICNTQRCSKCKKITRLSLFRKNLSRKTGIDSYCILCQEKAKNRTKQITSNYGRKKNLERYNLTLEEYNKMFDIQNGLCAICKEPETREYKGLTKQLSVDHDHETGKVRALICGNCNSALGYVNDDKDILHRMIEYLDLYR